MSYRHPDPQVRMAQDDVDQAERELRAHQCTGRGCYECRDRYRELYQLRQTEADVTTDYQERRQRRQAASR